MMSQSRFERVYLARGNTDLRKSIDGLAVYTLISAFFKDTSSGLNYLIFQSITSSYSKKLNIANKIRF